MTSVLHTHLRSAMLPSNVYDDASDEERAAQFGLLRRLYRGMGRETTISSSPSRSEGGGSSSSSSGDGEDGESDIGSMPDDRDEATRQMQEEMQQAMRRGLADGMAEVEGSGMSGSAVSESASDEDADEDEVDDEDEDDEEEEEEEVDSDLDEDDSDLDPFETWRIVYVLTSHLIGMWNKKLMDVQYLKQYKLAEDVVNHDLMRSS